MILLHVLLPGPLPEGLRRAAEVEHVAHPVPGEPRNLAIMPQEIMARANGVTEVEATIEQGDTAQHILDKAAQSGADMIVMGRRDLGGLKC